MGKNIESYFAKFPNIPDPAKLRERQASVFCPSNPGAISTIHPLPDDASHYAYIGKVAVEWATLEAAIDVQIWRLCGAPHNLIACLTAQMVGPTPRLQALVAICSEKPLDPKTIDDLEEFKKYAGGVAEQRNRVVHDSWRVISNELTGRRTIKRTVTAKGRLKMEDEEISVAEFERLIFKIRRLNDVFRLEICSDILRQTSL